MFAQITNSILIVSAIAMFVLFVRHVPETVEDFKKRSEAKIKAIRGPEPQRPNMFLAFAKNTARRAGKKVWTFMLEAKDLKQGRIMASKFMRLMPESTRKEFNIGALSSIKRAQRLFAQGDLAQAEQAYLAVLAKYPHEYPAYEGLVQIYMRQKNYVEVQETLEYLVEHNNGNDSYLAQLGSVLMRRRMYKQAAEAYTRALAINNLVPVRFVNLALCCEAIGEYGKARQNFQKALDLEPTNVQYLMLLVDLLEKAHDYSGAKRFLLQAREMNPDDPRINEKLASLESTEAVL